MSLLFTDVDRLTGLVINHNDPTECSVLFQSDKHIIEVFKLLGTIEWMGTDLEIDLRRPREELVVIIRKPLDDTALEEGEEYEYIPIDPIENVETHSSFYSGGREMYLLQLLP